MFGYTLWRRIAGGWRARLAGLRAPVWLGLPAWNDSAEPAAAPPRPVQVVRRRALLGAAVLMAAAVLGTVGFTALTGDDAPAPSPAPPPVPPRAPARPAPAPTASSTSRPAPETSSAPAPSPSPSDTPGEPSSSSGVAVTSPSPGQRLPADRDFEVKGTVRGLDGDDLRIFFFVPGSRTYFLGDYRAEDVPDEGRWTILSTGLGMEWGRDGDVYLLRVVRAGARCRAALDGLDTGQDHYPAFRELPEGCAVAAQVHVVED